RRHEIKLHTLMVGLHDQLLAVGIDIGCTDQKDIVYTELGNFFKITAKLGNFLFFGPLLYFIVIFDRIDMVKSMILREASLYRREIVVMTDQGDICTPAESLGQYGVDIGER